MSMSRRRSIPWIHRASRPIIAVIAAGGALTTAYLTYEKLTGGAAVCPTGGCDLVLNSAYGTVFGQPLALFGCLAYTSMLIFALIPMSVPSSKNNDLRTRLENWTWLLLLAGAVSMTVFSGYLMYLLFFKIKAVCYYCLASALFSLSMLVLTIIGRVWEEIGQIFFTAIVVGMFALIATLGIFANVDGPVATSPSTAQTVADIEPVGQPVPGVGWEITTTSSSAEIALARHLKQIGAKEYIAWWCPHCHEQKQLFGKEAYKEIDHIECAEGVTDSRPDLCKAAKIPGFPTWQINGKLYPNVQPLKKLAQITEYKGPTNFKNFPDRFP